ncbi:translocation/assembly module TamB domain-containing protein [Leyella stercorea]|uniref:translocation/assembly module TamB domain-containing protein n=1 Tax=Leyella stercorea TaxID=363265 RepID=UPI00242DE71F
MFKRTIKIIVWAIAGLYLAIVTLLHIPFIQNAIGECVSGVLSEKLGTKVSVGRVDLGFINRIIIDDSQMLDQQKKQMLNVSRISVKINLLALANGQIEITSAQFFGLNANLYKATPEAKPNFQFVIDSLASKDTTKQQTPINLQINSLIIRNSSVRYRVLSRASEPQRFSPDDIEARNISAHFIVNRITNDSLNVKVKRLSLNERCGFTLRRLALNAIVSRSGAQIEKFRLELPESVVESKRIVATYSMKGDKPDMQSLRFEGSLNAPCITPSDVACFVPKLRDLDMPLALSIDFNGTGSRLNVNDLSISTADHGFVLKANAHVLHNRHTTWRAEVSKLFASGDAISKVYKLATSQELPAIVHNLGDVSLTAKADGTDADLSLNAVVGCAPGSVKLSASKQQKALHAHVETRNFALDKLLGTDKTGVVSLSVDAKGSSKDNVSASGSIYDICYNGYTYRNIDLKADYINKVLSGSMAIDDPNVRATIEGLFEPNHRAPHLRVNADVQTFVPAALKLTNKWNNAQFSVSTVCDIKGSNLNNAEGQVDISNFTMQNADSCYSIRNINVVTGFDNGNHFLNLKSDFGTIDLNGHFSYNSIARSVLNLIADKLPTIPGLEKKPQTEHNDFTVNAYIHNTEWLQKLLGVPLEIHRPLSLSGELDDKQNSIDLWCDVPSFTYNGTNYRDAYVNIESPGDTLKADIRIKKISQKGKALALKLRAGAFDNHLNTTMEFKNDARRSMRGVLNASTVFAKNEEGESTAYVDILESRTTIGDTTWHIHPAHVTYYKNHLNIDGFKVSHGNQAISVDGTATNSVDDSLTVKLKNVDVNYVLDLINFHSVEFYGMASGTAYLAGVFGKAPLINSDLQVDQFKFEGGRMGTLFANIGYDSEKGRIEFDAVAKDEGDRRTIIDGYVSPRNSYIDLGIKAEGTRAEFLSGFCDSFMDNINANINGKVNVVGAFKNINLIGKAKVDGSVRLTALNTTYALRGDSVYFLPDEIRFCNDTIYDRHNNIGIMTGGLHHHNFSNWTYDINVEAKNLLAYDTHSFDGESFYGTAYTTGTCQIRGKSGEVTIDVNATPERNSILVYNAADNSSLSSQNYIQWRTHEVKDSVDADTDSNNLVNIGTNIKLNFLINCTPDATLKIIMDEKTGDYIKLNGEGVLRATYFNKGTFDLYGNYYVDHGTYKLTIQNIIKKDFEFLSGGSIAFGGDPYNATLDLSALYVVNSVSLADLNIGNSFSNNNVRVNCLMNITGTPESPKVSFNLDMPTLSNDAKQMVHSLLNAEEETNQQVLYLLAVGRFYAQNDNNNGASTQQFSQTSLAMQSFLSGTISQQINTLLSSVINNNNWNFGANISTGTDGFYNAEYEGILSGKLLNNRLLLNGQFGYRDNPNTTNNFIGDFDMKYLLFPNGNLAINVYNKTNDRYFTRNSLNTQGLGLVMKTDFNRISDLFFWKRNKKAKEKK